MHSENDVLIEFGRGSLIIEVDGVRTEVRGEDSVRSVKVAVARMLLEQTSRVPMQREVAVARMLLEQISRVPMQRDEEWAASQLNFQRQATP